MTSSRSKPKNDGQIAGLYDLKRTIGTGHFAVVKLAKHVFTGEEVAVKVIDKTKLDAISKDHLFQEVRCMKLVQHPNVVRLYEVIDTQTKLYLILELGDGGDMFDYIMKHEDGLSEDLAKKYFKQIIQAINYCHKLHVVHRDLKPENVVFFKKNSVVKLTDFGFSNKFVPGRHLETACGSLAYSAPEILLGDAYDPPAVDLWSLGVILFMLVVGKAPFAEANDSETLTMIMDCKYKIPKNISDPCKDLIKQLLVRDPKKRISLDMIENHDWLSGVEPCPLPSTPLISRKLLSSDDHKYIVQKMVDGKIGTNEEITKALEKDPYSHLAATYFLLAERLLRKQHSFQANQQSRSDGKPLLAPLALSPRVQSADAATRAEKQRNSIASLVSPVKPFPTDNSSNSAGSSPLIPPVIQQKPAFPHRRISLIKEESIEEDEEDMESVEGCTVSSPSIPRARYDRVLTYSKDDTSQSEESDHSRSSSLDRNESPVSRLPITLRRNTAMRPLKTVRSSPNMLNEIYEEGESDEEGITTKRFSPPKFSKLHTLAASPEVLRRIEHRSHRKRLSPSLRGTSASSSDASDNDESDPNRKRSKEKLKGKNSTTLFIRRDSSDHSSDTDAGPGVGGIGGAGRSLSSSSTYSTTSNQTQGNTGTKNDNSSKGKNNNGGGRQKGICSYVLEEHTNNSSHSANFTQNSNNNVVCSEMTKIAYDSESEKMDLKIRNIRIETSGGNILMEEEEQIKQVEEQHCVVKSAVYIFNEENKYKGKVINVRSKEFDYLKSKFSGSNKYEDSYDKIEENVENIVGFKTKDIVGNVIKFRRHSKDFGNATNSSTCSNADGGIEAVDKDHQHVNGNSETHESGKPAKLLLFKVN